MKAAKPSAAILWTLILLAALGPGTWAGQFTNGGFESAQIPRDSGLELPVGDTSLDGWVVGGTNYSGSLLMNGFPPNSIGPLDGSQFLVFDTGNWPTGGIIYQTFDTTTGHRYV